MVSHHHGPREMRRELKPETSTVPQSGAAVLIEDFEVERHKLPVLLNDHNDLQPVVNLGLCMVATVRA